MKRLLALILCLCTIATLTLVPVVSASANDGYYYVNSYKNGLPVRVRPQPNTTQPEICKLNHRAYVLVYEYNPQSTWAYIEASNPQGSGTIKGWISTEFLCRRDPGPWKNNPSPVPVPAPTEDQLATLSSVCGKIKPVAQPYTAEITTKNPTALVHLRWFPNTGAKYRDAFPRGTEVTVIAKSNKWTQVIYTPEGTEEQHVGFVLTDNVLEY